jgi:hypothetical protein
MDRPKLFGMTEGLEREGKKAWGGIVVKPLAQEVEIDIPDAIRKATAIPEAERASIDQQLAQLELRGRIFGELIPLTAEYPEEIAKPAKSSNPARGMSYDEIASAIRKIAEARLRAGREACGQPTAAREPKPKPKNSIFLARLLHAAETFDDEKTPWAPWLKAYISGDDRAMRRAVRELGLCDTT